MKISLHIPVFISCFLGLGLQVTAQNAFTNGSLDFSPQPANGPNGVVPAAWTNISNSDTAWDGWALNSGQGQVSIDSTDSGEFVHSLYDATLAPTFAEGIEQTVSGLTVGATYVFSFEQSQLYWDGGSLQAGVPSNLDGWWDVQMGTTTLFSSATMSAPTTPNTNTAWQNQSFTFIPTSSTATFSFLAKNDVDDRGAAGRSDMLIDGISLVAVPEPGSSMLLILGTSLLCLRRRVA